MMAKLPWAIGKYAACEDTYWYIYGAETDMTICESPVRETLEVILEVVGALQAMVEDYECECGPDYQCSRCQGVIMLEAARQGKRHWLGRVEEE